MKEQRYEVTSDNLTLGPRGAVLAESALAAVNVPALIAGGHLTPVGSPAPTPPVDDTPGDAPATEPGDDD